ncbi:MAG: putative Ig domain-containing protein [Candidatus Eisenbacteria bacterium]
MTRRWNVAKVAAVVFALVASHLVLASTAEAGWAAMIDPTRLDTCELSWVHVGAEETHLCEALALPQGTVQLGEGTNRAVHRESDGAVLNGRAPVVLTSDDFFDDIGDYYRSWCNSYNVSVGGLLGFIGGPQTWDFSTGPTDEVKRFDYVPPDDGDNPGAGFHAATRFPDADFSQRMTEETGGGQAWMYLDQVSSVGRTNYGFYWPDANSQTDDWSVFSPAILDFPDPITYADSWFVSTTYYFQMYDLGEVYDVKVDLSVNSEADAWGTVILPDLGPVDCLRVNGQQTSAIYIWMGDQWLPAGTQCVRSYYWVGVGSDVMVEISSPVSAGSMPSPDFATAANFLRQFENSSPTDPPEIAEVLDQTVFETYAEFTYDIEASGTPAPVFSLLSAPGGMTIEETTGLIEWTPTSADAGRDTVTVLAENGGGTDTETFVITVVNLNEPPENMMTELFNSGPTELAWDAPASAYWLSGYNVHHSTTAGGPYDLIAQVGPYEISVLLDASGFSESNYYVVTAELEVGREIYESASSNEVLAYSLAAWETGLWNDDGSAESGQQAGGANGEMAAKLELEGVDEVTLTKVAVFLAEFVGAPVTMKVSADDAGGYPGSSVAQAQYPASMLREGWNILEIPEFMQPSFAGGGFFVGVVEGATNNTVGLDDGTYGHSFTKAPAGAWSFMFSGELMFRAIVSGDEIGVPETEESGRLCLMGSYPNPTSSGVHIAFRIPESCSVVLRVFDASGREVAHPLDKVLAGGVHHIRWDGRSAENRSVASGVYFYELEAGGDLARGRILVVR